MANQERMDQEIEKRVGKAALRTLKFLKQICPTRTSRLKNSIVLEKRADGFVIGTNVEYAKNVELGTGLYGPEKKKIVIKPKGKANGGADALFWKGAKHPVKKVEQDGFPGRYMFQRASKQFEKFLKEELQK